MTIGEIKERSFSFHWGSGVIAEEAQVESSWHVPTFQLLKFTEGDAAGQHRIRFCQYNHQGRFRRSPLMISAEDIDDMRVALKRTPKLLALLRRLVQEPEAEENESG